MTSGARIDEELEVVVGFAASAIEGARRSPEMATLLRDEEAVLRVRLFLDGSSPEGADRRAAVLELLGRALLAADTLILAFDAGELRQPKDHAGPEWRSVVAAALTRPASQTGFDSTYLMWPYRRRDDGEVEWGSQVVTRWGAQILRRHRSLSPVFESIADGLQLSPVAPDDARRGLVELGQEPVGSLAALAR